MTRVKYWKFNIDPYVIYDNITLLTWNCKTHNENVSCREDDNIQCQDDTVATICGTWFSNNPIHKNLNISAMQTFCKFSGSVEVKYECRPVNIKTLWREVQFSPGKDLSLGQERWQYNGDDRSWMVGNRECYLRKGKLFVYTVSKVIYKEVKDGVFIKSFIDTKYNSYFNGNISKEDMIELGFLEIK